MVLFVYVLLSISSRKRISPHTTLLYRKTGVYRGIPNFLRFDPKHRLKINVLGKSNENINFFPTKFSIFNAEQNFPNGSFFSFPYEFIIPIADIHWICFWFFFLLLYTRR